MKTCAALNRAEELKRILDSFDVLEIPGDVQKLVLQAVTDREWDWFKRCDGCTCVSEAYWPTKYFPPCLRHDYDWQTGRGGWEANARFYRIQRAYRMSALVAGTRFIGVTVSWFAWFKWVSQARTRGRQAAVIHFYATRSGRVRSS
jgi:hypothetical protein